MVLDKTRNYSLYILLCITISACSTLEPRKRPPIVPVEKSALPDESSSNPKPLDVFKTPVRKHSQEPEAIEEPAPSPPSPASKNTNILSVLLSKAEQAKNAQQWLRAQRIFEQALRIAPTNPVVFLKYGDLHLLMGGREKAKSMYERALYLAHKRSDLEREISEKLTSLEP